MIDNFIVKYNISISHFLIFTSILFLIGLIGVIINRKSLINILLSIEIILLSVNLNFVIFSRLLGDITGQIFMLFILSVAAAEAVIGLAILIIFFRKNRNIDIDSSGILKG
ncbi:MAG: NADH-quinone oxidoreductase subunit K [Candidatus Midichloriaceae bacterium]|jgi:NADH-quinone oxidoreductase subunit K